MPPRHDARDDARDEARDHAPQGAPSRAPRARDFAVEGREFGRLAGMGMQFALTILVLAFGGYWIDQRLGTLPLFLIVGVLLGFVGGTVSMVKRVSPPKRSSPDDSGPPS